MSHGGMICNQSCGRSLHGAGKTGFPADGRAAIGTGKVEPGALSIGACLVALALIDRIGRKPLL